MLNLIKPISFLKLSFHVCLHYFFFIPGSSEKFRLLIYIHIIFHLAKLYHVEWHINYICRSAKVLEKKRQFKFVSQVQKVQCCITSTVCWLGDKILTLLWKRVCGICGWCWCRWYISLCDWLNVNIRSNCQMSILDRQWVAAD